MKRLAVLSLLIFTFLFAPRFQGLRTVSADPAKIVNPAPGKAEPNWSFLFDEPKKDEPVVVECQSKNGVDKCVPKYRFSEEVSAESSKKVIKWIEAANKAHADELLIEINTPGGSVPDGFELARAIEESDAPVTCVADGNAESMGFYLLQACDHRAMTKRSKLMAHEPALGGGFSGQPNQWQGIANMMKAEADALAEHCQHRLKISLKEYHEKVDGSKMWFLTHNEAMKVAAVDEVVVSVRALHDRMLHSKTKFEKQP